jgi:hypothetical protein
MKMYISFMLTIICLTNTLTYGQDGFHNNPKPILVTGFINAEIDKNDSKWNDPLWTSKICSNNTWLKNDPPKYEWTPIISPDNEFSSIVGVSGVALNIHSSTSDMPFTHPFGFDYNYLIVPDNNYEYLLGPSNGAIDPERSVALEEAKNSGINVPKGFLAVEEDNGLIPGNYRVPDFSRVAVFGRWIVDCGHDNFLTEIHPPLLTVFAQGNGQTDVAATIENSITRSKVISLPYLISQNFENGDLRNQIAGEVTKAKIGAGPLFPVTSQMKAKPVILKPFSGIHIFQYTVRPPVVPNLMIGSPNKYELFVEYQFTVRNGITIQIAPDGSDAILVTIVMNDANFEKDDNTLNIHRKEFDITPSIIGQLNDDYGTAFKAVVGETFFADPDPVKAAVINRGFLSDIYDPLTITNNSETHRTLISNLVGNTQVMVDNSQPFPIYGFLNVGWASRQVYLSDGHKKPTEASVSQGPKVQTGVKVQSGPKR